MPTSKAFLLQFALPCMDLLADTTPRISSKIIVKERRESNDRFKNIIKKNLLIILPLLFSIKCDIYDNNALV